jgi:protein arginine N-methyltransferase 1
MYSIAGYGHMIADSVRTKAYAAALQRCVRPGSVVLDIGTGTGLLAMLACQAGARRVYAVEPDDAILLAREIAADNGFAERIEFVHGVSSRIALPERVDVIVSDLRGALPLFQHHLPSIIDARRRFLAPHGTLIPLRDLLCAAVVEAPDIYGSYVGPWNGNGSGLRMQAGHRLATNTWGKASFRPEQLLTEPRVWSTLDYATVEAHDVSAVHTWNVLRPGSGHGLSVWFESVLTEGVGFSNAPGAPRLVYGSAFFPWSRPVDLAPGDTVSVRLQAKLVGADYIWRWSTRVASENEPGLIKADYEQSTFYESPKSPATLRRRAASHIPTVSEEGQIDRHILMLMDGNTPLNDIAAEVVKCFRHRFPDRHSALTRVGELSQRYSL